jgi:hypothetical protein
MLPGWGGAPRRSPAVPLTTTTSFPTLEARVIEFSKFSGEDGKTTLEHVGQFILQCGETIYLSLSGTAFT